jgi:hypothetical protein
VFSVGPDRIYWLRFLPSQDRFAVFVWWRLSVPADDPDELGQM